MSKNEILPHHLDSIVALAVAETTPLQKQNDEKDTAFVKRIVCAYLNAHRQLVDDSDSVGTEHRGKENGDGKEQRL
jgi:hypothetical protein